MPVNPRASGDRRRADLSLMPRRCRRCPSLAVIATPPATVPELIAKFGSAGTRAAVVITAGFGEGGDAAGDEPAPGDAGGGAAGMALRIVGPNCIGVMVPKLGPQRQLRAHCAQAWSSRVRCSVGRDRHLGARLGDGARHRLLAHRLARRHVRRRFRRHARLSARRSRGARHPALYRGGDARPQVHVGGASRGASKAGGRDQGRPSPGSSRRRRLAHRSDGRR